MSTEATTDPTELSDEELIERIHGMADTDNPMTPHLEAALQRSEDGS